MCCILIPLNSDQDRHRNNPAMLAVNVLAQRSRGHCCAQQCYRHGSPILKFRCAFQTLLKTNHWDFARSRVERLILFAIFDK